MIADDLFAGAGGWDLAAAKLGIHARGVETMKDARATRDAAGLTTIHDDVWTYRPDGRAAGLITSPPCPPWSQAGKQTGVGAFVDIERCVHSGAYLDLERLRGFGTYLGDDRIALVLTPLHFAMTGSYRWLAWEQVGKVLPIWELCAGVLEANGWNVWTGLLHAEQYGVPQTRKRAFLLASLDHPVAAPTPTHSMYYPRDPGRLDLGVLPWNSMASALGWGRVASGELPMWCADRPATTIVGSFKPEVVAAPGYRVDVSRQNAPDSVTVTIAEAGVLQSFPADYPWQGAKGKQFLQCGNAVPPGMAQHALAAAAGINAEEVAA